MVSLRKHVPSHRVVSEYPLRHLVNSGADQNQGNFSLLRSDTFICGSRPVETWYYSSSARYSPIAVAKVSPNSMSFF